MSFTLRPLAPFRLDYTVCALRRDSINPVDRWESSVYRRLFIVGGWPLEVAVEQTTPADAPKLVVSVTGPGVEPDAQQAVADLLRIVLGLDVDLTSFYRQAALDEHLMPLVRRFFGLKPPITPSVFETLVSAIACQQLSLVAGMHLLARLSEAYGVLLAGHHAFPRPEDLVQAAAHDLRRLGFSMRKSQTILSLADEIVSGHIDVEGLACVGTADVIARLITLPGIGRWTAHYVALRGLRRLDTFPTDDVGGQNKLQHLLDLPRRPDHEEAGRILERWHPYQGLVYFYLLLDDLARTGRLAADAREPACSRRSAMAMPGEGLAHHSVD
jgi:DNA-3-methyladenine glycosylase II